METLLYISIIAVGVVLIVVNEFFLWKIWPRIFYPDISTGRKALVAIMIIDPLIASIVCPFASDVYFALDWLQTCRFYLVFTVSFAIAFMYGGSLAMSFKLISTLIPTNQKSDDECRRHRSSMLACFTTSLLINLILTWITFSLTLQGADTFSPSEECFPFSVVHDSAFFVCAASFSLQLSFTVLYACLSMTVRRRMRSMFPDTSNNSCDDLKSELLTYCAISLVCLLLGHCLRSAFIMCSCLPFLQMMSGIHWTNWLVLAKLPCVGLVYFTVSKFT